MRYFMTVTPWILVEAMGEKLEARWSFKPAPCEYSYSSLGVTRLARIDGPGFSFDRRLLGLTALSIMSGIMEVPVYELAARSRHRSLVEALGVNEVFMESNEGESRGRS